MYSSVNGHLSFFHFSAVVYTSFCMDICFFFLLGIFLDMEFLSIMVILCLTFWGIAELFFKETIPFYISASSVFFHNLSHLVLIWISPMAGDVEHLSGVCHIYILSGKMTHVFCPFSNLTSSLPLPFFCCSELSLHILDESFIRYGVCKYFLSL